MFPDQFKKTIFFLLKTEKTKILKFSCQRSYLIVKSFLFNICFFLMESYKIHSWNWKILYFKKRYIDKIFQDPLYLDNSAQEKSQDYERNPVQNLHKKVLKILRQDPLISWHKILQDGRPGILAKKSIFRLFDKIKLIIKAV